MEPLPISAETYRLDDVESVATPSVVVYPRLVDQNVACLLRWADEDPARLRPHVKTHKTREIIERTVALGIKNHKCATLSEADLLARSGAEDVLVAYPMVGPNIRRLIDLVENYPKVAFHSLVDHSAHLDHLVRACRERKVTMSVYLDVDAGMGRTGVPFGETARELIRACASHEELRWAGLHVYDGDADSPQPEIRRQRVLSAWDQIRELEEQVRPLGVEIPSIVVAGTGTFHHWLEVARGDSRLAASPGTYVLSDWNYHVRFADTQMVPAAILLTRVISKPRPGRLTCDLGHKAVAADAPGPARVHFLGLGPCEFVRQSEEHLVIDTPDASHFEPGDVLYALPYHICPTCALYRELLVADEGRIVDRWPVAARDRI